MDELARRKRARARRDNWVLLGVCLASALFIVFVLWINAAFQSPTK